MVTCYDCQGEGYTVFLGNESTCSTCKGARELIICSAFALDPNGFPAVFRNQRCHNCGVRQNDHITTEVTA